MIEALIINIKVKVKKYGWGISHWRRICKTLFGVQGLSIPESPAFRHGEYVKVFYACELLVRAGDDRLIDSEDAG